MSAVEWLLHYHELNGKTDREEILKYFKNVHIQFKGETDLQTAFDSIALRVQNLESYGLSGHRHPRKMVLPYHHTPTMPLHDKRPPQLRPPIEIHISLFAHICSPYPSMI